MKKGQPSEERRRGRDEVTVAVLDAALHLFAERGPAAVTLREIAEAANVNVGLIHRHLGTKHDLLVAVLRGRLSFEDLDKLLPRVDLLEYMSASLSTESPFARAQGRAILDGYDLSDLQGNHFPGINYAVEQLKRHLPEHEAQSRAVLLLVLHLGWQLAGSTFMEIVGLGNSTFAEVSRWSMPALEAFINAPPQSSA